MQHTMDYHKLENYVDPNHLIGSDGVTFIYTTNGNLYTAQSSTYHKDMLKDDEVWRNIITYPLGVNDKKMASVPKEGFQRRSLAENNCVLGRTGNVEGRHVISFWGEKRQFLEVEIKKCLDKMLQKRLVELGTEVHSMIFKKSSVRRIIEVGLENESEEANKKQYSIDGTIFTWEELRSMRAHTHNDPTGESTTKLCRLLREKTLSKYPELKILRPTKCKENSIESWNSGKHGNLSRYMANSPKNSPIYPTIGDSIIYFKNWLKIVEG